MSFPLSYGNRYFITTGQMDAITFKSLVLPLSGKLLHFAHTLLQESGEAEDAVQEAYLKLWKIRDSLEQYNSLEAFAMKMVKNWCLDRLKAKRPVYIENYQALYDKGSEDADPHLLMEKSERHRLLNAMLEKLPEQQRLIIQMRDIEGLEFDEMAEIMDMQINAIRVCLSRARNKIRDEIIKFEKNGYQSDKIAAL